MIFQGLIIFINNIYIEICGLFYRTLLFWFVFFMTKKILKIKNLQRLTLPQILNIITKICFFFEKSAYPWTWIRYGGYRYCNKKDFFGLCN